MTDQEPIIINSSLTSLNSTGSSYRTDESNDSAFGDNLQIDDFYSKCKQALGCLKTLDKSNLASVQDLLETQQRRTQTTEKLLCTIYQ